MHGEFVTAARWEGQTQHPLDARGSVSSWLLRPYLDLTSVTDLDRHPIHCLGIEAAFAGIVDPHGVAVPNQVHPPPLLREHLLAEVDIPAYDVRSPQDLPVGLRTDRWQSLVALTTRFSILGRRRQARVATLLSCLGLHSAIASLVPEQSEQDIRNDADAATLALRRAQTIRYLDSSANGTAHNEWTLRLVAEHGPEPHSRLAAALTLVVSFSRSRKRDVTQAAVWRSVAEPLFDQLDPASGYPDVLYASMFWRAVSYVPFLRGDADRTVAELDLAQRYADEFVPADDLQRIAWRQNQHTVLETRTKEALWLGESGLALARAKASVANDPVDSKVLVELGDVHLGRGEFEAAATAYRDAACLGAPYTAFAHYMAGHCLDAMGERDRAVEMWACALRADPASVSVRQRLAEVAGPDVGWLRDWAVRDLAGIRAALANLGRRLPA